MCARARHTHTHTHRIEIDSVIKKRIGTGEGFFSALFYREGFSLSRSSVSIDEDIRHGEIIKAACKSITRRIDSSGAHLRDGVEIRRKDTSLLTFPRQHRSVAQSMM